MFSARKKESDDSALGVNSSLNSSKRSNPSVKLETKFYLVVGHLNIFSADILIN